MENSKVQITDINMPFMSMVTFMVKWTIASIPAMIILFALGIFFTAIFGSFMGAFFTGSVTL